MKQHHSLLKSVNQQKGSVIKTTQARAHKTMSQPDNFKLSNSGSNSGSTSALGAINKRGSAVAAAVVAATATHTAHGSIVTRAAGDNTTTAYGLDAPVDFLGSSLRQQKDTNAFKGIKEIQRKSTPSRSGVRTASQIKISPVTIRQEKRLKTMKKKKMHEYLEKAIDEEFEKISKNFLVRRQANDADPKPSPQ